MSAMKIMRIISIDMVWSCSYHVPTNIYLTKYL